MGKQEEERRREETNGMVKRESDRAVHKRHAGAARLRGQGRKERENLATILVPLASRIVPSFKHQSTLTRVVMRARKRESESPCPLAVRCSGASIHECTYIGATVGEKNKDRSRATWGASQRHNNHYRQAAWLERVVRNTVLSVDEMQCGGGLGKQAAVVSLADAWDCLVVAGCGSV